MVIELTREQKRIQDAALDYARKNKKKIAKQLTNSAIYCYEEHPVSVFMAGSPGAGKTEASIALLNTIEESSTRILRIDPDNLRTQFAEYNGSNSWLFQPAVSILVERIHDLALKQNQSFILDGTLASQGVAAKNIQRSLKKDRLVQILYVYQDPLQAWQFVLAREKQERRRIRRIGFINQYFAARESVNQLKETFGRNLSVDLLIKNNDGTQRAYKANINRIDSHMPES